ncbi:MAG: MBL fold metallo-hydrolase [Lentisphaerae bacterium]|nr:MBL fold metallo-hydrolase [Lentisphaerota bacterium]
MHGFVIRGSRGTLPTCGADFLRYGGDTTCFSLETEEGLLVIDTGTGLRHVTQELADRADLPPITVLLTHLHMDHLIGLPSFTPLYSSHAQIRFMADPNREGSWKNALRAFMRKPYWPIGLNEADANLEFDSLPEAEPSMTIYGVTVTWCAIPHPQQCVAYRLESPECSVVIATDVEFTPGAIPDDFVAFCRGARHLIFDAHFTPAEIAHYKGWGHSTWEVGVELAKAADIARLVLTHHSPKRRDAEVDAVVETARASFPAVDGAYTNMVLD